MKLKANQSGLALGSLFGVMHLLWVLAVAIGIADELMAVCQKAHFVSTSVTIGEFSYLTAFWRLIGAFVVGYIIALVFTLFYRKCCK